MSYTKHEMSVIEWAQRNGLLDGREPMLSLSQVQVELGDLMFHTVHDNPGEISDAVGFCLIHLIVFCAQQDVDLVMCLESAMREMPDTKPRKKPTHRLQLVNPIRPAPKPLPEN